MQSSSKTGIKIEECENNNMRNANNNDVMDVDAKDALKRSEFVVVSDKNGETLELPTTPDNSLFMTTLQSSFPGATGMKYKNPKTGALRAVAVDAGGTRLLPPADGWDGKVFTVITSKASADRGSDVSVKRRKMGTCDGESDSDDEGRVGRKRVADDRDGEVGEPTTPSRPVDLIVLGVNYKTTDEGFKKYFEAFGTVVFSEIKKTAEGSSKGFGFVQMSTLEEQKTVLATACHILDGRRVEVRTPDQKDAHGQNVTRGVTPPKTLVNKIFVGRLTESITEDALREYFGNEAKRIKENASVTDVFIPRPFRGFAFVTFTHAEVADRMCRANDFTIDGTSVVVTLATPRQGGQQTGEEFAHVDNYGYGYGYGNPGMGDSMGRSFSYPPKDTYGYSPPPNAYQNSSREGWQPPQMVQRSTRAVRPQDPSWSQYPAQKIQRAAAYPGTQEMAPYGAPRHAANPYGREKSAGQAASNQIANGMDALNLNQRNPELLNAAWNAFIKTFNQGGGSPYPPKKW